MKSPRLLETDSKSMYSVNGVLRSPTSPKTLSFEDGLWGNVIKEWDDWRKRKVGQIKLLCDAQNVDVRQNRSTQIY
ncbi:ecotropic viral integration site 5 protein-like [Sinocyclocheilus grahami]|uniref:ecotropic viral integration site 5 protein-like n=1 Tax=Sinocyclocheilus grahami TaxID=75366 RepID=UPI0007AC575F|nr:PREDICTED: ecotropic viral integration site 5 protein-like [Sinocyclocheilus grahami]